MASVRLKVNMIIDGEHYVRGSLLEDSLIPPHLRTEANIEHDIAHREGVMLLHDLSFQSLPRPSADGILTSYPVWLRAGSLVELATLPAVCRETLMEGRDFKTEWADGEPEQVQRAAEAVDLQQLIAEPVIQNI
jgi:hypothetical protein